MNAEQMNLHDLFKELGVDPAVGLSAAEVSKRQQTYGPNRLQEKKKKSMLQRFLEQFKDAMIIILLIAAAISFGIACVEGNPSEFFEPLLILLIVIANAVMGVVQENKAEKALDALQNLSAPHARVLRDGKETRDLVSLSWCPGTSSIWKRRLYPGGCAFAAKQLSQERGIGADGRIGAERKGRGYRASGRLGPSATGRTWCFPDAASPTVRRLRWSRRPACRPKWGRLRIFWNRPKNANAASNQTGAAWTHSRRRGAGVLCGHFCDWTSQ